MGNKLGILIAGYGGAISSTVVAALDLMTRGLRPRLGMICETTEPNGITVGNKLGAPDLADILISGWDVVPETIGEALVTHQVLTDTDIRDVSAATKGMRPILLPQRQAETTNGHYEFGSRIEKLRQDIQKFRADNQVDWVVVVNCMSTQPTPAWSANYESLEQFQTACAKGDPCVTPSMEYACAAILEGAGYVNFTPNLATIPALLELANQKRVPLAGKDGKTGQTLLKTALAPMFKLRGLQVQGWFSTNILGNRDGEALSEPDACNTKVTSKESCLDNILGYEVDDHQVYIHYYRPRRDNKEAWDNIDVDGFLGYSMQLKVNFLCRDSILAAPLILDLARLMAVSMREGEYGPLTQLSMFFKSPEVPVGTPVQHDLFVQRQIFEEWVEKCAAHAPVKVAV